MHFSWTGVVVDRIRADVERLEAYTERTSASFGPAEAAVEDHQQALRAYQSAPDEVASACMVDVSPDVAGTLLELQQHDVLPRAFAGALRALDESGGPVRRATDGQRFDALVGAQVAPPGASPPAGGEVPEGFLSRAWRGVDAMFVPDGGDVGHPLWWFGNLQGVAVTTVRSADQHLVVRVSGYTTRAGTVVDDHVRWWPRTAPTLNRVTSASSVTRVANSRLVQGATNAAPFVMAGVGQVTEDWSDADLTTGDRVARTGAATMFEGGGAWAGGTLGAKGGAMAGAAIGSIVPGAGTAVGAAVGGIVGAVGGGIAGSEFGGWVSDDLLVDQIEWASDQVDGMLEGAGDLVDGAGDLLSDAGDLVGSIF